MQTLKDINKIVQGDFSASSNVKINNISIDSRTIQPGDLYIAIVGENHDGHKFLADAKANGAVAAIVSTEPVLDIPHIHVASTLDALIQLAKYNREKYPIPSIAVTGSCGKTTTRSFISSILSKHDKTITSEKSYNNNIGVALTLLKLNSSYKYAAFELGANHPGEIAELTHLVHPQVAVITNAAPAHLAGFGDLPGVACAKSEIFQGLAKDGVAIINADDAFADFWTKISGQHKKVFFSCQQKADVYSTNHHINSDARPSFTLNIGSMQAFIQLPFFGEHNIANALAAAAACNELGVNITTIATGIATAENEAHRLIRHPGINGCTIYDDTYNANPQSVAAAIDFLAQMPGETILVFGDMAELGENSVHMHSAIGKQARERGIRRLYTCGDLSANSSAAFGEDSLHFDTKQDLITHLQHNSKSDQVILIKASRSMHLEELVAALTQR